MREIKFRGQRTDNGEWAYGWYAGYSQSMGYIHGDYVDKNEVLEVDADTIGQYTGLPDKDGQEIYEGDIIEFNHGGYVRAYVIFDDGAFDVKNQAKDVLLYLSIINHKVKIIGNIHDNPDLLAEVAPCEK